MPSEEQNLVGNSLEREGESGTVIVGCIQDERNWKAAEWIDQAKIDQGMIDQGKIDQGNLDQGNLS